ncbi:hypothetical protein [Allokutzneria albata]|uniref:hypothetical protein n=1 Tax=Allokutzneria albata TaxID=211114 RepID=UPI0012DF23A1|nr:hypothetical protein [Allokutzneria albata]
MIERLAATEGARTLPLLPTAEFWWRFTTAIGLLFNDVSTYTVVRPRPPRTG